MFKFYKRLSSSLENHQCTDTLTQKPTDVKKNINFFNHRRVITTTKNILWKIFLSVQWKLMGSDFFFVYVIFYVPQKKKT